MQKEQKVEDVLNLGFDEIPFAYETINNRIHSMKGKIKINDEKAIV